MSYKALGRAYIPPSRYLTLTYLPQYGIFNRVYANAFHLALLGNRAFLNHKSKPFFSVVPN